MASLYLHIPFCKTKCCYCDFNSSAAKKALYEPYLVALEREIAGMAMGRNRDPLATLFIGGGTPTVLTPIQLVHLIKQAEGLFGFTRDIEVSLEANPGTVSGGDLIALREGGVNRLSFGVQSFNDSELRTLGRCHTRREAEQAVRAAHQAGFKNINLDLMYGLPGQDCDSWQRSLDTAISLTPKHLSLYQLTVEPATPIEDHINTGKLSLPDEDGILEMDTVTKQFCEDAGMKRYEISNYAEEGFECRHNVNYWRNEEYLAAGAGSVSYLKGLRAKRVADSAQYIDLISKGGSVIVESEELSKEAAFRETVVMGLRMTQGVSLSELYDRYAIDLKEHYGDTLSRLIGLFLLRLKGDRLHITEKGFPLANRIMAELV